MAKSTEFDPSTIKWDEAPKGYPLWIQDLDPSIGFDGSGWHRKEADGRYFDPKGEHWDAGTEGEEYTVHTRPVGGWDGTGNPPVGAFVYTTYEGVEAQVRILGYAKHSSGNSAVTYEDVASGRLSALIAGQCEFSIESAATKAERDQLAIDIFNTPDTAYTEAGARKIAEHLHKLGYRKP